jgi:hypothetical protein
MSRQTVRQDSELNTKIGLTCIVLFTLAAPVAAKEPIHIGHDVVLTKASPACAKRSEFDALVELAERRDAAGFADYMASHDCPVLNAGTAALYEDQAFSGRAMCIRRPGDSNCFWIPAAAVQKAAQALPAPRF